MSLIILIQLLVLLASGLVIGWFAVRHFSQLRVLNIETSAKERNRKMKEELILRRFANRGGKPVVILGNLMKAGATQLRRAGRRAVHKLRDLESQYQTVEKQVKGVKLTRDQLQKMVEAANTLVRQEKYSQAEKKFIEIISLNPRYSEAYEYLGRLYTRRKEYEQALQSLSFAKKIDPENPSIMASLGELYESNGQFQKALEQFEEAVEMRPGNPKYIDGMLEAALSAKNLTAAERALELLKEANPENQKIGSFEERIQALRLA